MCEGSWKEFGYEIFFVSFLGNRRKLKTYKISEPPDENVKAKS